MKAGQLVKVENKNPHAAANDSYLAVWVEDEDGGNERCLLFTDIQIKTAQHRANQNKEDLTKKGFLTDLFD